MFLKINKTSIKTICEGIKSWKIPLVSMAVFSPIALTYLLTSETPAAKTETSETIPALSQIPSPTKKWEKSPTISDSEIKPPTPMQTLKQQPTVTKENAPVPKTSQTKLSPSIPKPTQTSSFPSVSQYQPPNLEIRVAILRDAATTHIASSTAANVVDRNGQVVHNLSANQGVSVSPNGSNLQIGSHQVPGVVFIQPSNNGLVYVGDSWYRGRMLLVSQGNSLMAVSYVDLEAYLYSVVGSEMHATAPAEALKAQAIAARSYALVHMIRPANPWYHLGNTQRWQVYKGIKSEYNTTQQAVNATAGQILSYKGGVVESLYAATDEIVSRAHGGRGMSQTGAYGLARQGYDHQQILGHYYPGVGLAQLVAN